GFVHAVQREVEAGTRLDRARPRLVRLALALREKIRGLKRRNPSAACTLLLLRGRLLRRFSGRQIVLRFRSETLRGGSQACHVSLLRARVLLGPRLCLEVLHLQDQLIGLVGHPTSIHLLISAACSGSSAQDSRIRDRKRRPLESMERRSAPGRPRRKLAISGCGSPRMRSKRSR